MQTVVRIDESKFVSLVEKMVIETLEKLDEVAQLAPIAASTVATTTGGATTSGVVGGATAELASAASKGGGSAEPGGFTPGVKSSNPTLNALKNLDSLKGRIGDKFGLGDTLAQEYGDDSIKKMFQSKTKIDRDNRIEDFRKGMEGYTPQNNQGSQR